MPVKPQTNNATAVEGGAPKDDDKKATFIAHLSYASGIVRSWPDWKRQVLGGVVISSTSSSDSHQQASATK